MTTHTLELRLEHLHGWFDRMLPPVLRIQSGDTVILPTSDGNWDDVLPNMPLDQTRGRRPFGAAHALSGPIWVEDAQPGDTLEVAIREMIPRDWGYVVHHPGKFAPKPGEWGYSPDDPHEIGISGVLADQHDDVIEPLFKLLFLDRARNVWKFADGVEVPCEPFMGILAVAPNVEGRYPTLYPGAHGGNIDCKELKAGASIFLPVLVPGALFSVGDGHGAQGDGEVDGAAMEIAMERLVLDFTLHKGMSIARPRAESATHLLFLAFHEDLDIAVLEATRDTMHYLTTRHGLTWNQAYNLCSLAVDFRISQVVDGWKGVHAMLPKALFTSRPATFRPMDAPSR